MYNKRKGWILVAVLLVAAVFTGLRPLLRPVTPAGEYVTQGENVYQAKTDTRTSPPGPAWQLVGILPGDRLQAPEPTNVPPKVVAYFPYWQADQLQDLPLKSVTHINYAFASPTWDGGLMPLSYPDVARDLIARAAGENIPVLLSVGGWDHNGQILSPVFRQATQTPENRHRLVQDILQMVRDYGFAGVDIDWEYPSEATAPAYEAFMLELADALHSEGKLLTAAVVAGVLPNGLLSPTAFAQTDAVLQAVDWINIMAYDGGVGALHSPYDWAVECLFFWRSRVPAEKAVLGIPFYGLPGPVAASELLPYVPNGDSLLLGGDLIFFNGPATVREKTIAACTYGGGVMIWEVTLDGPQHPLLATIQKTIEERKMKSS